MQNLNILGVALRVDVIPPIAPTWSLLLLPGMSSDKDYCRFAPVPVAWGWKVSKISDAANLALTASWNKWN